MRKVDQGFWGAFLFNLSLGFLFTTVLTAPSILFFDTHIFGYPHDGFEYMWKMWWYRKALFELHISPAQLSYVNYPFTGSNPHIIASSLINILALPLINWLGSLRTYNFMLFVAFALSVPTGAILCYEFTKDQLSATVGGLLYAFHANRVAHAIGGHLPQMFNFFFPIMAVLLFRTWRNPTRRNALLSGFVLALSLLVDLKHVALFIAPFLGLFFIFFGIHERSLWSKERLLAILVSLGTSALVAFPFFIPLIIGRITGQLEHYYVSGVVRHSADLLGFFVPPPEHPIYSHWPKLLALSERLALPGWHENIYYLGWTTIGLSILGTIVYWKQLSTRFWQLVVLVTLLLALGPVLKVGEEVVTWRLGNITSVVPLPYAILQALPGYDWGRTPGRMVTLTMLGLSVLTSLGVVGILSRVKNRWVRPLLALGLMVVVVVDHIFVWPWPLGEAEVPTFYELVANQSEDFAILDFPLWEYRCERYQLYYATVHNHPIIGGMITRRSLEAEKEMREVESLILPENNIIDVASELEEKGVRYVIIHKLCLENEVLNEEVSYLTNRLGPPIFDDSRITVFLVK